MDKKMEFKKLANGKCAFLSGNDEVDRTEVVSVEYVKKHYREIADKKNENLNNLQSINKKIKENAVEMDAEMEKFIEMANKANRYAQHQKDLDAREGILKVLGIIEDSMKQIEKVLPEVKRLKK